MKAKRIKATLVDTYEEARFEERRWSGEAWQLPADADSYAAMMSRASYALYMADARDLTNEQCAAHVLRAIGIVPPKRGKKGSK